MAASQRVSRGFHRLALFLAAIPLLVGGGLSLFIAIDQANKAKAMHEEQARLMCAQTALKSDVPQGYRAVDGRVDLQKLGCSDLPQTTSYFKVLNARPPKAFSYARSFLLPLSIGVLLTLPIALAVYGVVCAIGWVGGFRGNRDAHAK